MAGKVDFYQNCYYICSIDNQNDEQMKRFSIALLLGALFFMTVPANAQFKWGVEGGVNLNKACISGNAFDASNRTGWFIGPKAQFTVPILGLGIDGAILYSQKYLKLSSDDPSKVGSISKDMPYIDIPVNVKWNIGFSSLIGAYIATGPQYSWYLGGGNLSDGINNLGTLNTSTFSWNFGVGLNMLSHIQLGVTYNIAIGETGHLNGIKDVYDATDIKNNMWQVRLAYMF